MSYFLDLRKNVEPRVKVVYKTIIKHRPWYIELTKVPIAVIVVGVIVWGISRADVLVQPESVAVVKTFSVSGLISSVAENNFSIGNVRGFDNADMSSLSFGSASLQTIQTSDSLPLQLSNVQVGDRVVVQGTYIDSDFIAIRLIDFTSMTTAVVSTDATTATIATMTATVAATSTDILASATPDTSSFATSTISTSTDDVAPSTETPTTLLVATSTASATESPDTVNADNAESTTSSVTTGGNN
jgi:hypothetical protein